MAEILTLVTAGLKPDQLADIDHIRYPRVDYIELQRLIDLDVLDYTAYNRTRLGEFFRRLETQLRSDLYLAMLGLLRRHRYCLSFAMSERAGIPFSALNHAFPGHRPLISIFAAWSTRQERVITGLDLFSAMDVVIVNCQSLKDHFLKLGASAEHIEVVRYGVDQCFFSPMRDVEQQIDLVMSVGEVRGRDYKTLFQAVHDLPMKLLVAASGSWYAREKNTSLDVMVPGNVTIAGSFSRAELKGLYTQSQFVVLPLYDVPFSAGATVALEAMCMGRAVIASRSRGILDYVVDHETGILVEPGDVEALREAIEHLLAHPEEAQRLGRNARQRVEEELNLDTYVESLARILNAHL